MFDKKLLLWFISVIYILSTSEDIVEANGAFEACRSHKLLILEINNNCSYLKYWSYFLCKRFATKQRKQFIDIILGVLDRSHT